MANIIWIFSSITLLLQFTKGQKGDGLKAVETFASGLANLKCNRGEHMAVLWEHNDRILFFNQMYQGSESDRHMLDDKYAKNYNLLISNIKMSDSGVYLCRGLLTDTVLAGYNVTVKEPNQLAEQESTTEEMETSSMLQLSTQSATESQSSPLNTTTAEPEMETPEMETKSEPKSEPESTVGSTTFGDVDPNNGGDENKTCHLVVLAILLFHLL